MSNPKPPIALTIAGFDPSSGAGITADLQVFASHGLFGTSAITALTVQNTLGVHSTHPVDRHIFRDTLQALAADLPPAGIKIGMLATRSLVEETISFLRRLTLENGTKPPIVLDPVILSSSGAELLDREGIDLLRSELLPLVTCATPNLQELTCLADPTHAFNSKKHGENGVQTLMKTLTNTTGIPAIITTGGDQADLSDILYIPAADSWHSFSSTRIETTSTHGTGCAYSSALLSNLVLGKSLAEAAVNAKQFVEMALKAAPGLGAGRGPMKLSK